MAAGLATRIKGRGMIASASSYIKAGRWGVVSKIHWPSLLISIAIAEAVGAFSGLLAGNIRAVYNNLVQPPLSPPGWLFPLVWTILFALMGIAAYLVYRASAAHSQRGTDLRFYAAQLVHHLFPLSVIWLGSGGNYFTSVAGNHHYGALCQN